MHRAKAWILALGMGVASANGVTRQVLDPGQIFSEADPLFLLLAVALIFTWYRLDVEEHQYARSILLNAGVIALALVAFPYYLFRAHGPRRGLYATGIFLALGVTYSPFWSTLANMRHTSTSIIPFVDLATANCESRRRRRFLQGRAVNW